MSRVGKKPITIPEKTKITYSDRMLNVAGEKGTLNQSINSAVDLKIEDGVMNVTMITENRTTRALQGLTRSLIANMITGVNRGFQRKLEINGIGYRAELSGKKLVLHVGYSNLVQVPIRGRDCTLRRRWPHRYRRVQQR